MSKVKVLFLAADPLTAPGDGHSSRLLLDENVRRIRQKVRAAEYRDELEFDFRLAARTDDLIQALSEVRPQVVHFSGHGMNDGLVLVNGGGREPDVVPAPALKKLFQVFRGDVRVVVLSACFSLPQAEAIAASVGCVIGTPSSISDQAGITFDESFYRAIAFGHSVQTAYDLACAALALAYPGEQEYPQLVASLSMDPALVVLIPATKNRARPSTFWKRVAGNRVKAEVPKTGLSEARNEPSTEEDAAEGAQQVLQRGQAAEGAEQSAPQAPEPPQEPSYPFSVAPASISDQPALHDSLGFNPYVSAIAEFLTNEGTRPPLTLSIEGEWGSGKSSFMHQLQQAIRERQVQAGKKKPVTVWFNPWRHDREEAVWAAFALEFLRGVSTQLPFVERWRGHLRLMSRRFSWRDGWLDGLRALTSVIAALAGIGILVRLLLSDGVIERFTAQIAGGSGGVGSDTVLTLLLKTGGVGASLAVAVTLWKQLKSFVANPLRFDLKQYFRSPDYQSRISFIEHFHEDFGKIVKAYVGERKVYVFIDDLDRCQTPKAADLMQALNLMMGTAEQPLVFILGMDREKIAASLAVKFKDLLPYVTADPARPGKIEDGEAALRGLEYGSEFIEKFVQLSFRIPRPADGDVAALLRSISGGGKPVAPLLTPAKREASTQPLSGRTGALLTQIPVDTSGPIRPRSVREAGYVRRPVAEPVREALQQEVAVDSERLHEIVRMVAPALDYNPRRVKQFVNVFRLKAYLAIATHLIGKSEPAELTALTFEKLGKFVALGLRWPMVIADLEGERDLLERLQARTLGQLQGDIRGAESFWFHRAQLLHLLRVGLLDGEGNFLPDAAPVYSMKGLDVDALLQVAAPPPVGVSAQESTVN